MFVLSPDPISGSMSKKLGRAYPQAVYESIIKWKTLEPARRINTEFLAKVNEDCQSGITVQAISCWWTRYKKGTASIPVNQNEAHVNMETSEDTVGEVNETHMNQAHVHVETPEVIEVEDNETNMEKTQLEKVPHTALSAGKLEQDVELITSFPLLDAEDERLYDLEAAQRRKLKGQLRDEIKVLESTNKALKQHIQTQSLAISNVKALLYTLKSQCTEKDGEIASLNEKQELLEIELNNIKVPHPVMSRALRSPPFYPPPPSS